MSGNKGPSETWEEQQTSFMHLNRTACVSGFMSLICFPASQEKIHFIFPNSTNLTRMSRKKSTTKRTKNGERTSTSGYLSFQKGEKRWKPSPADWQACARACRHTVWGRVTQAMNAIISGEWWTGKNQVAFYRRLEKEQQYTLSCLFFNLWPRFCQKSCLTTQSCEAANQG